MAKKTPTTLNKEQCIVSLSEIKFSEDNQRIAHNNKMAIQSLADSIRNNGLLHPITIKPNPDGGYIGLTGYRRFLAHELLGAKSILSNVVWPGSRAEELSLIYAENNDRESMHPMDEALLFEKMQKEGLSTKQIAETLGISPSTVVKRVILLNLIPELQTVFIDGALTVNSALTYSRYDKDIQAKMYDDMKDWDNHGNADSSDFSEHNVQHDDVKIPLDFKAGSNVSCKECHLYCGNRFDFSEDEKDLHCTNRTCYDKKEKAFLKSQKPEGKHKSAAYRFGSLFIDSIVHKDFELLPDNKEHSKLPLIFIDKTSTSLNEHFGKVYRLKLQPKEEVSNNSKKIVKTKPVEISNFRLQSVIKNLLLSGSELSPDRLKEIIDNVGKQVFSPADNLNLTKVVIEFLHWELGADDFLTVCQSEFGVDVEKERNKLIEAESTQ